MQPVQNCVLLATCIILFIIFFNSHGDSITSMFNILGDIASSFPKKQMCKNTNKTLHLVKDGYVPDEKLRYAICGTHTGLE